MERGLPTTLPSPTNSSANNSCLITGSSGILPTWPRRVSRAVRMCISWDAPRRCAHLSRRVQGAVRTPARAGDPGAGRRCGRGADDGLQLLVCEAADLRYSVKKGWDDVDAVQHGLRAPRVKVFTGTRTYSVFKVMRCMDSNSFSMPRASK
eukprot:365053-Chlamydomonas_euryale.AAC.24